MLLIAVGFCLIALASLDIAVTTLTTHGAGPLSSRLMQWLWAMLIGSKGGRRQALLPRGGLIVLTVALLTWVLLLWGGWSAVFWGSGGAIVDTRTGTPAEGLTYVYYAGFTLFTLGLGDYKPVGSLWQVLTAVCAANGLLALTLSVTYLVPVMSAAAEKRRLALTIAALGGTPSETLRRHWDGNGFGPLGTALAQLTPALILNGQQHLAYPAIHYFHSPVPAASLPLRLAALDDMLTMLQHGVAPSARPPEPVLLQARFAVTTLLDALRSAHISPADAPAPAPSLGQLAQAGIPVVAADRFEQAVAAHSDRRRLMRSLVENDGWTWDDVGRPAGDRLLGEG